MEPENFAIECHGAVKAYGTGRRAIRALDGVSLAIRHGEIVGLVGPNGAGKTTLLGLVAGLLLPDEGSLRIHGSSPRSLIARRLFRYMPETPAFLDRYTCRQMLQYHGALAGLSKTTAASETARLLAEVGLTGKSNASTQTLSQGSKQRLALAIALLGNPRVLILDEPGNGLDPAGAVMLRGILDRCRRAGGAVLISSHRLSELEKLDARLIFLRNGRVIEADRESGQVHVHIGFQPNSLSAEAIRKCCHVVEYAENRMVVGLDHADDVPELIRTLVKAGMDITGVAIDREDAERTFIRVYGKEL